MNCKVCGNTSSKNSSLSFFRFPKENTKCKDWAARCDLMGLYEKHGTARFYKSYRICSDHFNPKDIIFDGRKKRLLQSAIPQILNDTQNSKEKKAEDSKIYEHSEIFQMELVRNLCRLCAEENKNLTDVYGCRGKILNLEAKLKYLPIEISKYDILPLRVCCECISKINQIHDFILNCINAETKFRIMLDLKDYDEYKPLKSNAERQGKVDWDLGVEHGLNGTPSLGISTKNRDSSNPMSCFSENVEDNFYDKLLQESFISENEPGCFFKQPENDFVKTNQSTDQTNFIRGVEFSENINYEHEHSNTMSRSLLQTDLNNQTKVEISQNFVDGTKHPCDICLETFCSSNVPNAHSESRSVAPELYTDLFCEVCNKVFFSRLELDKHTSEHSEESFECKICDKKFRVASHKVAFLEKHLFDHQLENSCDCASDSRDSPVCPKSDKKTGLKCLLHCKRNETSLLCNLNQSNPNVRQTNLKSPKRCQFCDRLLKNSQVGLTHEKSHAGETLFECKQCGKKFRSKPSLRQHRSVHSDTRLYTCQECGMSFKRKDTLGNHLRIHTGERPFVCKVCGFAFKQRGDCIKHERNHEKTIESEVKENSLRPLGRFCDDVGMRPAVNAFISDGPQTVDEILWKEERNSSSLPTYIISEEIAPDNVLEDIMSGRMIPFNFLM